ncbi:monovalent cation:proton antiporter-2 (CPA2) family protein [Chitinophaga nivalis]|uniref:Monovalent cation:proton antiporter-2 (CPA2) family protein n=1 Tax=Chitinophaga nivalis TaxID=2991709 RepID=A0ABT3IUQ8_9BACT|nr:monovalent cation:proton antiporter-2 (CPA2) family protein [Chitinophaga nivalis]MCW3462614.1 monovalent cation:proton antiporter-2 (CPA2) family protein [Chitinophaga nivalis]MCW3487695.1 monovalent cation:proton antiporter-2 (CPA2) family protein [Chitinophaga nivalis]
MDQHSLLFQSMVYLAAAIVFVPIAKKLGLGAVLGYLLAGVIIGPSLLGFIGKEGEDIMHFAEFGVVMMLFLIGIELEPALLWRLRASILGLGGLQVTLSAAAIAAIALWLGQPLNTALALGMILSLSSTAIVLQTLNEKGWMETSAGQSAFSVLLFQDIAVIPMLAIFPLLAGTAAADAAPHAPSLRDHLPGWGQTLVVLGAVAVIIVAGRYLVRPLMRVIARTRVRELFTATALLMVVAIAVLMNLVGLSSALGAFLGGVVLANSEYRHELESDIEPFKGLLLGLFFIAVGASIDFKLIMQQPWLIMGLVVGIMTIKGIVLLGLGKIFKLSTDQNLLFAFALADIGEFAFVLLSFTNQTHLMSESMTSMMTAVVAISMALTPLIMLLYEKVIQPHFTMSELKEERDADEINEKNPVIIAGFGRFGSMTGRFLRANGIHATILDMDSDRVDALHNLGIKVYYGDASRYDLLAAAGAKDAKILIIATDNTEQTREIVVMAQRYFPHLQLLVRSKQVEDTFELMDLGVLHIYRETVDTSLRLGVDALRMLGQRAYHSERAARTFFRQDERSLKGLSALRDDKKQYVNSMKERIEEMEKLISSDRIKSWLDEGKGWDASPIRDEVRGEENKDTPQ